MHESEWLPKILLKSDMLHVCNLFNLSVDGFRKESLSTRPVEQLRALVTSALKTGIGLKKRNKGKIPIHAFYKSIAEEILLVRPDLETRDLNSFILDLEIGTNFRPFQKLALLYELFHDIYITHYEKIIKNIVAKQDLFHEIFELDESKLIELLKPTDLYPSMAEYEAFVEKCGYSDEWDQMKKRLGEMKDDKNRLSYLFQLSGPQRFLGQLTLLSAYEGLNPVVYRFYMDAFLQMKHESASSNEQIQELNSELNKIQEQAAFLNAEILLLNKVIVEEEKRRNDLEAMKELLDEMLPKSDQAIIITDQPDSRIKELFLESIFSKSYVYEEKQNGNIENLKEKVWFIDRTSFTNTKEWVQLRHYFTENGFQYEEYNDYLELIRQYANVFNDGFTEEYE